ncbi:MAG: hypothetical protein ACPG49_01300 [Chitinophagales bacterium]
MAAKTETQLIEEMQSILQTKMEKDYQKGNTKRDAHPKSLGMLKASFKIMENLPKELKIGVFEQPKIFKAWIRFSSSNGAVQSDKKKDFRGIGIKLLGIEGERFTNFETQSQDFILLSHPTMPLGTVQLFRDVVYYSAKWNPLVLLLNFVVRGKAGILKELQGGQKNQTSPLDIRYWSETPYKFGDRKVKYKIVPTSKFQSTLPNELTDDYLTFNMQNHLHQESATFDFCIQFFKDETQTPIEDASIEWKKEVSPFIKVAELEIPMQEFNTPERFELAEQYSFSIANSLTAHHPIGGLNRARTIIYRSLSKFRHKRNNKKLKEPLLSEFEGEK